MPVPSRKTLSGFLLLIFGLLPMSSVYSQEPIVIKIESLSKPEKPLLTLPTTSIWESLVRSEARISTFDNIPFDHNIITMGEAPDSLVYKGFHPFLQGMYEAYSQHRPFVLSPDMINLLICQGFSKHVNVNSEQLRYKFTDSKEKIALCVRTDMDLVCDSVNWGLLFAQFSDQIAAHAGQELVNAMTNDFTTTGLAERIASEITLMDATKPYFDFYVVYAVCGIPEVTLLGTTEDWQKVYDNLSIFEDYDLRWWTSEMRPVLKKIIETTRGKMDVAFWRNMFKVHTSKEYGDRGTADGWILKFFPYDSDGNRLSMRKMKVNDIRELPHEMVKVEVKYQIRDSLDMLLDETPLEVWAGFVGLEQNKEDYTLKPVISWMVRKKDPNDDVMVKKIQRLNTPCRHLDESLILTKLIEVPLVLKQFDMFFRLGLYFKDKVFIPEWMKDIEIGFLTIRGKISSSEKRKILEWFPNTVITINGKLCQEGTYIVKNLACWGEEELQDFYKQAEIISELEQIWLLDIFNFYNTEGKNEELIIPTSLEKVKINYLNVEFPISETSLQRIMEQFPNTIIYVAGEVVTRK